MKLKTIATSLLLVLTSGCGEDASRPNTGAATNDSPPTPTNPATAQPPARTLIVKPAMATRPENLLTDPEFQSLWSPLDESGFGLYESFANRATVTVRIAAESPAGPGVAVASITPEGKESSLAVSALGGTGPLSASVWVSSVDGEAPELSILSLLDDSMFSLTPDPSSARTVGGVKYVAYRSDIAEDLPGSLYFVVTFSGRKPVLLAAPELSASMLAKHVGRALSNRTTPTAKALRAARGLEALREKYKTMRLLPRTAPPKLGRAARGPNPAPDCGHRPTPRPD